jgi:Flp pilus assembly protein TadG
MSGLSGSGLSGFFCRRIWRDTRGAELLEMAFMLPFLCVVLIGTIWMGRAFNIWETLNRAAREGARVATARNCTSCGNAVPTVTAVENAVLDSLTASSINKNSVQIPAGCAGNLSSKICYQRDVVLNSGSATNAQESGSIVSLSYPVSFPVPLTAGGMIRWRLGTITLKAQAQMREEN